MRCGHALTWHADAVEVSDLVQAGGLVQTRVGLALVDVQLAARPHVAQLALTLERALGVQTLPGVLARVRPCGDRATLSQLVLYVHHVQLLVSKSYL